MTTKNQATIVSRTTLEDAQRRAPIFLKAAGMNARIRALLDAAGYSKKAQAEGWKLYFRVVGYAPPLETPSAGSAARSAFDVIETWQSTGFPRARAALRHKHPEIEHFVFNGLTAVRGAGAIGSMATFLDRCEALESSPDRKATRKADHAALALLEERGITRAARKHLRARVDLASVDAEAGAVVEVPSVDAAKRNKDLYALYRWLQDWSETARAVVTRRDDRIRLGISKRRQTKAPSSGSPSPVTPATQTVSAEPHAEEEEEEAAPESDAA